MARFGKASDDAAHVQGQVDLHRGVVALGPDQPEIALLRLPISVITTLAANGVFERHEDGVGAALLAAPGFQLRSNVALEHRNHEGLPMGHGGVELGEALHQMEAQILLHIIPVRPSDSGSTDQLARLAPDEPRGETFGQFEG